MHTESELHALGAQAAQRSSALSWNSGAYALTIFLSAFLLFQIQPIMGRIVLPWFGGSAAVWTTCLLFFQALLLLGYLYAHALVSVLSTQAQR
jgi:hypothetical protein